MNNGTKARVYSEIFNLEEEALIRFYQEGSYYNFNQTLIRKSSSEDVLAIETMLNKALDIIPSKPCNYSRGAGNE